MRVARLCAKYALRWSGGHSSIRRFLAHPGPTPTPSGSREFFDKLARVFVANGQDDTMETLLTGMPSFRTRADQCARGSTTYVPTTTYTPLGSRLPRACAAKAIYQQWHKQI